MIRLAGNYSGGELVPLLLGGEPVISLTRDVGGLLLLSVDLKLSDGTLLARIHENSFEADPMQICDLVLEYGTHVSEDLVIRAGHWDGVVVSTDNR